MQGVQELQLGPSLGRPALAIPAGIEEQRADVMFELSAASQDWVSPGMM